MGGVRGCSWTSKKKLRSTRPRCPSATGASASASRWRGPPATAPTWSTASTASRCAATTRSTRTAGASRGRVLEFVLGRLSAPGARRMAPGASPRRLLFFGPLALLIAVLQIYPEFVHYLLAPEQIASFHADVRPGQQAPGHARGRHQRGDVRLLHLEQRAHRLPDLRRRPRLRRRLGLVPRRERRDHRRGRGLSHAGRLQRDLLVVRRRALVARAARHRALAAPPGCGSAWR